VLRKERVPSSEELLSLICNTRVKLQYQGVVSNGGIVGSKTLAVFAALPLLLRFRASAPVDPSTPVAFLQAARFCVALHLRLCSAHPTISPCCRSWTRM
jgi:hypothetical protein